MDCIDQALVLPTSSSSKKTTERTAFTAVGDPDPTMVTEEPSQAAADSAQQDPVLPVQTEDPEPTDSPTADPPTENSPRATDWGWGEDAESEAESSGPPPLVDSEEEKNLAPVSYTHLTLPTICSV